MWHPIEPSRNSAKLAVWDSLFEDYFMRFAVTPSSRQRLQLFSSPATFLWAFLLAVGLLARPSLSAEFVEISEANWKSVVPTGKEADWIFGDFVLRNDKVTAVIANPVQTRNANMTVRNVAGAMIDLTFRYRPSDQLSCYYPGAGEFPIRYISASDTAKGTVVTVSSDWRKDMPEMSVAYELNDGDSHITVTTTFTNPHQEDVRFPLRDAVRADRGFSHRLTDSLYVCSDDWWRQAYGIKSSGHQLAAVGDSVDKGRPVISFKGESGSKVTLRPGESYTLKRTLIPGENEIDVESAAMALDGTKLATAAIVVVDPKGFVPTAELTINSVAGDQTQSIGRVVTGEAGPTILKLLPGNYSVTAKGLGRGEKTIEFEATQESQAMVRIELPEPGYVHAHITDDKGTAIPAKVQFVAENGDNPNFGPDTKSFGVRNVRYTANGKVSTAVAPGDYRIIISRGPEYDADFQTINVESGKVTTINSKIKRSVQSEGWVSSDFHSHSTPSGDNTSDQFGRVLNLLAEHIEFAPCTEHNRVSSYVPHLDRLKAHDFMATCTGMELTGKPLPINHQNAFPMHHHPHTQDGGGPITSQNPITQIERLAMWDGGSEKLIQENHPNLEQIWADRDLNGEEDEGFNKMFGFMDVIEVHPPADIFAEPGTKTGQYNNVIQSWLRMINKGFRIPGVVNTDAHYNFHGSGWLRNYIKSSSDQPTQIDTMEMVHESEHGHIIMTNGPFLEVTATSGDNTAIPGDDLKASDKKVTVLVKVQCPNWFDINRVQLLLNGRLSEAHHFTRRKTPQAFSNDVVKFEQAIEVELDQDTHIIAATIGDGLKLGAVMGPDHGDDVPVAFSNPIFVDVDADGKFSPNGDLLGLPFPYKEDPTQ